MDTILNFFKLIFFLALLTKTIAEYGERIKNATITWGENLDMEESRYAGYSIVPAPHTEIPITFQAPYIDARDYWTEPPRRTVFNYQSYVPQDLLVKPMNTFYGIMNHFFGHDEPPRRPLLPYRQQFDQKPFYIPPPKPLRASITKLEPTRVYQDSTPQTYPQFVKILNDVLTENMYKNNENVLEKPERFNFIPPTTYKPRTTKIKTTTVPPQSIQDQLPPIEDGQDVQIPYITEKTTHRNKIVFPSDTEPAPVLEYDIDVRNALPLSTTTTTTTEEPIIEVETITTMIKIEKLQPEKLIAPTTLSPIELEVPTTEIISSTLQPEPSEIQTVELIKTMEAIESTRFKGPFSKKLHSRKVTTDPTQTDYVSDLTLKSLTDPKSIHASVRFANPLNMTSVIDYVIGKYNATLSNFDDTLSLDAKILKDTNWDGYQEPIPTTTETITTTSEPTTTTIPPTTETIITTTPEEIIIATRISQTVSKTRRRPTTTTEEPIATPRELDETTTEQSTTTTTKPSRRGRKYQRRPKVKSFTNSMDKKNSTDTPVRFGASRPFVPKRTRPNVTLTFGNRTARRIDFKKRPSQLN